MMMIIKLLLEVRQLLMMDGRESFMKNDDTELDLVEHNKQLTVTGQETKQKPKLRKTSANMYLVLIPISISHRHHKL